MFIATLIYVDDDNVCGNEKKCRWKGDQIAVA